MILDKLLELALEQAVTDADAYTTNTYDAGDVTPKRDLGTGEPLCVVFIVTTAAAGATDTTDLMAVQSANADLSAHTELAKRRIANALLVEGAIVVLPIPPGAVNARYLGGRVELGTGDTVTVSAYILPQSFVQSWQAYARNFLV